MGLVVVSPMASVTTLLKNPEARRQLTSLAASFSWNAEAVALNTVSGYATWKIGIFVFVIAVWPLLAASRTLRGEEERGALDVLLALPRSRLRVALEKITAVWTALFAMGVMIGLIAYLGGRAFGAAFSLADGLLFGIDLALICAVMAGIALLVSQFTQERRQAAGWTAALLLLFIVLDMVHRVIPNTEWISHLSPIYYYNLSKPLIPSYGTNAGAMLLLLALGALPSGLAIWLFIRRDIGGTVSLPRWLHMPAPDRRSPRELPTRDLSLRTVFTRSLRTVAWAAGWWTLGIAGFAAWMVIVVGQMEGRLSRLLGDSSAAQTLIKDLGGGSSTITAGFLSAMFALLPLFLMAFAVTQVNRWSVDEQEGRLELILTTPRPRLEVLLAHFAALSVATCCMGLITLITTACAVEATGLALDPGNLAAAALGMIPLALLMAAIGYFASGWLRTAACTGLLSLLLVLWFFVSFIGPELDWPDATLRLSAFYYYGTPLLHGLHVVSVVQVLAVAVLALVLGAKRFVHKDIGT